MIDIEFALLEINTGSKLDALVEVYILAQKARPKRANSSSRASEKHTQMLHARCQSPNPPKTSGEAGKLTSESDAFQPILNLDSLKPFICA